MPEDSARKNDPLPTLDYAPPVSRPSLVRVVLSGLSGISMALMAAIFLLVGFVAAFSALFNYDSPDRGSALLIAMVLIGIGWLFAHLYLRWRRAALSRK